jgi:hypothetical protein
MAYKFQEVNIYVFDVHSVPKALTNPACVQNAFSFLVDENQYRNHYDSGQIIQTNHLSMRPLTRRNLAHNHFWKRYKDIWFVNGKPDYWNLQLPFVCEPINTKVKLAIGGSGFQANVRPVIFLSGMGWSSNLRVHLSGNIDTAQLIDFLSRLNTAKDAFLENSKPRGLVDIFRLFANYVRNEIYSQGCAPIDRETISRYLVISIAKFQGPLNYYKSQYSHQPQMTDSDRTMMLSILRGNPKSMQDWAKETNEKMFSIAYSTDRPDFGLIDFNRAALIFMQEAASQNAQGKLRCHGSNVRLCYMTVFSLLGIYKGLEAAAQSNPKIEALRKNLLVTLKELPHLYKNNMFCLSLYRNHKQLQELNA